ncbi:MAG: ABC transporter permease [Rhizobiaceae bacterium]|nr:ABC transporter permease [Rhizobiaceae bacterium]
MFELIQKSRRSGLSLIVLALPITLFILLCLSSSTFTRFENLANVNSQIAALLIASLGQGLVAISGGIDLSVGAVMGLTSAILVTVDPALAVPLALAVGVVVGLVNGFGVTLFNVHPLVMSLATMTVVQGMALAVHPIPGGTVPAFLRTMAVSRFAGMPAAFFWCVGAIVFAWFLLNLSRFGLRTYAVGANPISAGRNGIAVIRHKVLCFVLCSLSAVIAGIFLSARVGAGDATMGASYSLDTVTAMALGGVQLAGGTGSVLGVVAGVLTLGLISNGMNLMGISPFLRAALTGVLLLAAIGFQRRETIGA